MDFFEYQDQARRRTGWLVVFFGLAVGAIIAGVYVIARLFVVWTSSLASTFSFSYSDSYLEVQVQPVSRSAGVWQWDPQTFVWVVIGTSLVIVFGSLYKVWQLRGGGPAVATSLGGRLVNHSTKDPQERQLVNVVLEMAIASGTPTPPVYLLDHEPGINAFAAGHSSQDAAIAVTSGCVELLSREELQGIIAHEFSHILNGDMRLNLNLLGLIHGILIIGLTGRVLLRWSIYRPRHGSGSGRGVRAEGLPLMFGGLCLMTVGFMGVFFGNLIKAAVSRQREFLADAAAVQFTRYPAGLTGALKKIGGLSEGSVMLDPRCEVVSHMFFSQGISGRLDAVFSTHPPLTQRIRRIEPRFSGQFPLVERSRHEDTQPQVAPAGQASRTHSAPRQPAQPEKKQLILDPFAQIGQPSAAHLAYARGLLDGLPEPVLDAAHEPYGARALIYALLLNREPVSRQVQTARLAGHADPAVYEETLKLEPAVGRIDPAARLPLLDMAIPTLTHLSARQYGAFKANVLELTHAHQRVELFEWMLRYVLLRHLDPKFRTVQKKVVQYYSLKRLGEPCAAILSTLAYQSRRTDEQAQVAFELAANQLQVPEMALLPRHQCGLAAVDHALDVLAEASPREKRKVLKACAACILADKEVTVEEGELLRAIADSLGCPMPPLLAGEPLG